MGNKTSTKHFFSYSVTLSLTSQLFLHFKAFLHTGLYLPKLSYPRILSCTMSSPVMVQINYFPSTDWKWQVLEPLTVLPQGKEILCPVTLDQQILQPIFKSRQKAFLPSLAFSRFRESLCVLCSCTVQPWDVCQERHFLNGWPLYIV